MAARVTRGGETPDRAHRMERSAVVLLTAEDELADTVRPRVDVQGGDASLVHVLDSVVDPNGERLPSLVKDVAALEQAVISTESRLVIVDPLNAFTGRIDSHVDAQVRQALTPLAKMAERTGAAIVVVMHLNQATLQPVLYRVQGSIGYVGAARSVLLVVRDRDNPAQRILATIKSNLGPEMPAIGFTITEEPALAWLGVVVASIAALLGPPPREHEGGRLAEAKDFLRNLLADGPRWVEDVTKEADKLGLKSATLRRAREELGVVVFRRSEGNKGDGRWFWALPQGDQPPCSEDEHLANVAAKPGGPDTVLQDAQAPIYENDHLAEEEGEWTE